jgi:hypothetical protein
MVVIAVLNLDIDSRLSHPACDLAELAWLRLVESLNEHLSHIENRNASRLENGACGLAVFEEKVRDADAVHDKDAAALDAHSGAAEGLTHCGQRSGAILKFD